VADPSGRDSISITMSRSDLPARRRRSPA